MFGQMCWLTSSDNENQLILHLREKPSDRWVPYSECPRHRVPDYPIPNGSKGWSTYQKLMQVGWRLVPTAQAPRIVARSEAQRV